MVSTCKGVGTEQYDPAGAHGRRVEYGPVQRMCVHGCHVQRMCVHGRRVEYGPVQRECVHGCHVQRMCVHGRRVEYGPVQRECAYLPCGVWTCAARVCSTYVCGTCPGKHARTHMPPKSAPSAGSRKAGVQLKHACAHVGDPAAWLRVNQWLTSSHQAAHWVRVLGVKGTGLLACLHPSAATWGLARSRVQRI